MKSRCLPALLQTLSRLFHLIHFVKYWQFFLELNPKRLHQSSGTEIESRLVFTSSKEREIGQFHVVVVQWRERSVQKKCDARAKLLCYQSKPTAFLPLSLMSTSSLLSSIFAQYRVNVTLFCRSVKRETSKTTQAETGNIEQLSLLELWQPKARFVYPWISLLFFYKW